MISRLSSPRPSASAFFSDSNGRDFIQRKRDKRDDWTLNVTDPVAGNYYPVSTLTSPEDGAHVTQGGR